MKEAITLLGPAVKIVDSPIPVPNDDEVLIKVIVSGSNPKDWKVPEFVASGKFDYEILREAKDGLNQGDDIAGIVEKVGSNVVEFKVIALQHFTRYIGPVDHTESMRLLEAIQPFICPSTRLLKASTIPLAGLTAAASLYAHHRLPVPWAPAKSSIPFIVYGGSTAVGSFAIKLARNSNIHPIIAVAGKGSHYVESLIDRNKGDAVVDYRGGVDATVQAITSSLEQAGHSTVHHAIDTAIVQQSTDVLRQCVTPGGQIDFILPNDFDMSPAVKSVTSVGSVHNHNEFGNNQELGFIFSRYFTRALQNNNFSGHPFEVRPGGLEGVEEALKDLKEGKASATKYVFRVADTPGLA